MSDAGAIVTLMLLSFTLGLLLMYAGMKGYIPYCCIFNRRLQSPPLIANEVPDASNIASTAASMDVTNA